MADLIAQAPATTSMDFSIWGLFILFVLGMLALDLGVFHRRAHAISAKEALGWSVIWITLGLMFAVFVYFAYAHNWFGLGQGIDAVDGKNNDGWTAAVKYLTGYIVEKSLSMDNIFVIAVIFAFFAVPPIYQHRVLFWGIVGALVLRGVMIALGAKLIAEFHWILYVFGGFLILTAGKMLMLKTHYPEPGHNPLVRLARHLFPVTERFHGEHFFVRAGSAQSHEAAVPDSAPLPDRTVETAMPGTLMLTPLALALLTVETTDVVFAVDSIPAIFAITADPFLVFTSNVFAILGLRSLYFALAAMMDKFRYLKVALAVVLALVGAKMLAAKWLKDVVGPHFNLWLLAVVCLILVAGVVVSIVVKRHQPSPESVSPDPFGTAV